MRLLPVILVIKLVDQLDIVIIILEFIIILKTYVIKHRLKI